MMSRPVLTLGLLAALACTPARPLSSPSQASEPRVVPQLIVERVLGYDGEPLPATHMTITREGAGVPLVEGSVGSGGAHVELPESGVYVLRFAGVDHAEAQISVSIDGPLAIELKLGTHDRALAPARVPMLLRWIDADRRASEPIAVEAAALGHGVPLYVLRFTVPASARAIQYQIVDPHTGRRQNGPGGERWAYDDGGFWAERTYDGSGRLELDLSTLPPPGLAPVFELHCGHR